MGKSYLGVDKECCHVLHYQEMANWGHYVDNVVGTRTESTCNTQYRRTVMT